MSDGVYLSETEFTEWVRIGAIAKTLHVRIDRPDRVGDPYIVRQRGAVVYEANGLDALRDWLTSD